MLRNWWPPLEWDNLKNNSFLYKLLTVKNYYYCLKGQIFYNILIALFFVLRKLIHFIYIILFLNPMKSNHSAFIRTIKYLKYLANFDLQYQWNIWKLVTISWAKIRKNILLILVIKLIRVVYLFYNRNFLRKRTENYT